MARIATLNDWAVRRKNQTGGIKKQKVYYWLASIQWRSDELSIIQNIDKLITKGKYQKQDMKSCKDFQAFLANHCRVQHYTFQIRKCNDPACCLLYRNPGQKIDRLPDPLLLGNKEHFKPFTDVLGKETTEKDLPSSNVPTATEVASIQ